MKFETEKQLIEFLNDVPEWTEEARSEVLTDFRSGNGDYTRLV